MPRIFSITLLFLVVLLGISRIAFAQSDPIEKHWFNEEKTAKIHIYKLKDGKYYGKITWLKVPDRDGKPKTDERNPDESKRGQPIIGLTILKGFVKEKDGVYEDGTIYDPKSGKTYSAKMNLKGNKLDIRGYMGISMIGKTTVWYRAD